MAHDSGNFFATSRKGYDRAEVDAYVAAKAKEDAERNALLSTLEGRVKSLNAELTIARDETERAGELQEQLTGVLERASSAEATAAEATAKVAGLESEIAQLRQQEEAVRLTLVSATKTKDEMLEAAERKLADATEHAEAEAEGIRNRARQEAEEILERARQEADASAQSRRSETETLKQELDRLTTERNQHLIKLKTQSDQILTEREEALAAQQARFEAEQADLAAKIAALGGTYQELAARLRAIAGASAAELAGGHREITELLAGVGAAPMPGSPAGIGDMAIPETPPAPEALDAFPAAAPEPQRLETALHAEDGAAAPEPSPTEDGAAEEADGDGTPPWQDHDEADAGHAATADVSAPDLHQEWPGHDPSGPPQPHEHDSQPEAEPDHHEPQAEHDQPQPESEHDHHEPETEHDQPQPDVTYDDHVLELGPADDDGHVDEAGHDLPVAERQEAPLAEHDEPPAAGEQALDGGPEQEPRIDRRHPDAVMEEGAHDAAAMSPGEHAGAMLEFAHPDAADEADGEIGADASDPVEADHQDPDKGSFYSRRSGKLPRLGADASRSALTVALSMRRSGQHEDEDD
jgi:hypothetical protein